jgi:phosphoglycolate phosphatase-like HAD superfamily hydrolase
MVSGGERDELLSVFTYKSLINYFDIIMGGPKSKIENINLLEYYGESIFFGDSSYDLEVAIHFEMDFVFVSGYTKYSLKPSELNIQFKTIQNFNDLYSPC